MKILGKIICISAIMTFLTLSAGFPDISVRAQEKRSISMKTVVIDPGHGGKDPGCTKNGIYEKDIVLSVALQLGKMIQDSLPGVKVIYTRSTDKFIELNRRAEIANRNHADLFISIHVNATKSTSVAGSETFIMGLHKSEDNMEVCQLENSVITLEDDYSSKYEGFDPKNPESYIIFSLLQNAHLEQSLHLAESIQQNYSGGVIPKNRGVRQAGFLVLWKCTVPSVLTELGFLTNAADYKALTTKANHRKMAYSIFKAVKKYRDEYDVEYEVETEPAAPTASNIQSGTAAAAATTPATATPFRIQVLASSKSLEPGAPELKGLKCTKVRAGKLYKYTYGRYATRQEAEATLPEVRKKFPEAFIISL